MRVYTRAIPKEDIEKVRNKEPFYILELGPSSFSPLNGSTIIVCVPLISRGLLLCIEDLKSNTEDMTEKIQNTGSEEFYSVEDLKNMDWELRDAVGFQPYNKSEAS